jgi:hypothetical protein
MRVIAYRVKAKNYHGGPGQPQAYPASGLKKSLISGKISFYPNWAGLYASGLEGVNLAGMVKADYERSGGGLFWGFTILGLYITSGGLRYNIYILKTILRGLRAYEAQELN